MKQETINKIESDDDYGKFIKLKYDIFNFTLTCSEFLLKHDIKIPYNQVRFFCNAYERRKEELSSMEIIFKDRDSECVFSFESDYADTVDKNYKLMITFKEDGENADKNGHITSFSYKTNEVLMKKFCNDNEIAIKKILKEINAINNNFESGGKRLAQFIENDSNYYFIQNKFEIPQTEDNLFNSIFNEREIIILEKDMLVRKLDKIKKNKRQKVIRI